MITNPTLGTAGTQTGLTFVQNFVPALIGLAFVIATIIFFFILILGAIQWISAGSDKQAIEAARGKLINAIVGIVILFALFAVLRFIQYFFNITILTLDITPLVIQ